MSVDFLGEIKKHLTQNQDLIRIWGNLAENPVEWSQDRITLATGEGKFGKKEPTVTAFGVDSNLVSQHYDMIIMDDVVNRENTYTKEQIEKVILRYKDILDLLEPRGQLIIIGTRWNYDDLYGWILDATGDRRSQYNIMVKRAFDGSIDEPGQLLWPEKYRASDFQVLYKEKGSYEFSCQYLNDPIDDKDAKFRRDWFHYYDQSDMRGKQMNKYLLIDPAFEVKKDSDYTAMVSIGVDEFNNIFVLDVIRAKMLPHETINLLFLLYEEYHYNQIGIEEVSFGKTLQYNLYDEMNKRKRYLPITKLKPGVRTKDARIMGMQPMYEAGKVFHCKIARGVAFLEDELLRYPRTTNDDIIDALAYGLDIIAPARIQKESRFKNRWLY